MTLCHSQAQDPSSCSFWELCHHLWAGSQVGPRPAPLRRQWGLSPVSSPSHHRSCRAKFSASIWSHWSGSQRKDPLPSIGNMHVKEKADQICTLVFECSKAAVKPNVIWSQGNFSLCVRSQSPETSQPAYTPILYHMRKIATPCVSAGNRQVVIHLAPWGFKKDKIQLRNIERRCH